MNGLPERRISKISENWYLTLTKPSSNFYNSLDNFKQNFVIWRFLAFGSKDVQEIAKVYQKILRHFKINIDQRKNHAKIFGLLRFLRSGLPALKIPFDPSQRNPASYHSLQTISFSKHLDIRPPIVNRLWSSGPSHIQKKTITEMKNVLLHGAQRTHKSLRSGIPSPLGSFTKHCAIW